MPPTEGKLSGLPKGCREPSGTKPGLPIALFNLSARFRNSRLFAAVLGGAFGVSGRLPRAGFILSGFPTAFSNLQGAFGKFRYRISVRFYSSLSIL